MLFTFSQTCVNLSYFSLKLKLSFVIMSALYCTNSVHIFSLKMFLGTRFLNDFHMAFLVRVMTETSPYLLTLLYFFLSLFAG
jgi:hypothetical protein